MNKLVFVTLALLLGVSLFGCSSNKNSSSEFQFNEIVKGNISKITTRYSGDGTLYSTTDKKTINDFVKLMNSTTYTKVKPYEPVTGDSGLGLYDENNVEISSISSNGRGVYHIGDGYYTMNHDMNLASFYKVLYSKENIVQGKT